MPSNDRWRSRKNVAYRGAGLQSSYVGTQSTSPRVDDGAFAAALDAADLVDEQSSSVGSSGGFKNKGRARSIATDAIDDATSVGTRAGPDGLDATGTGRRPGKASDAPPAKRRKTGEPRKPKPPASVASKATKSKGKAKAKEDFVSTIEWPAHFKQLERVFKVGWSSISSL